MRLQNYELPPGKQYFGRVLNPFQKSLQNGKNLKLEKVFKMGMVLGYYASTDRQTFVPKRAFKTWIILVYTRFSGHFFSTGLTVLVTQKILISCRLIRVRRTEPNLNRKCLLGSGQCVRTRISSRYRYPKRNARWKCYIWTTLSISSVK